MRFIALIVKNDNPMCGNRVYVEAANVTEAQQKVYEQRPSDYYTAWCIPDRTGTNP